MQERKPMISGGALLEEEEEEEEEVFDLDRLSFFMALARVSIEI